MTPDQHKPQVRVVGDTAEAGATVAAILNRAAADAVAARGRFLLVIPGGSSPRSTLEALAGPPHRQSFPWSRTHVLWVDERAVGVEHPDSNFGAFSREFLPALPLDHDRIHRMRGELGPQAGALDYRQTLKHVVGPSTDTAATFDVVLLGVGEDGHVASLFPGSSALNARESVVAVRNAPKPPPERITLTMPALQSTRRLVILGLGAAKADAIRRSLAGEALPAGLAARSANALWIIDKAAADD